MFFFNPTYWLYMAPAIILMLVVQWYVNSAYRKWSQVPAHNNFTGAQAAQRLIQRSGLYGVQIEAVQGRLSDHYDPRSKVLRLSPNVYQGKSVASLAIAAHELGHALQDQEGYFPLRIRAALVPAVNIGSYLGWILIFIGLLIGITELAWLGLIVFAAGALFALATLPVELNASARAKRILVESGLIVGEEEQRGVNNVLNAAALTYVAALISAVMQLLYYASLVVGSGGRRRG
ncbi:MAG: zinc metallopeptidase [Anaerolineales bacterium]|jgi:Zn-dependent membrane protease YugP|nr:zinc metallopeptidase [Anaerolineales bacterium]MCK4978355.1 zinc metallopeptidase [Anaerolineales bacterium]MCK5430901.1 zinc metallopeptidase [Anaerolineales bacterium]